MSEYEYTLTKLFEKRIDFRISPETEVYKTLAEGRKMPTLDERCAECYGIGKMQRVILSAFVVDCETCGGSGYCYPVDENGRRLKR